MSNQITTIDQEEVKEEILDYVSNLFSISDSLVLDSKKDPLNRISELEVLKKKVFKSVESEYKESSYEKKLTFDEAFKSTEKNYLRRILSDLLGISPDINPKVSTESALACTLNEMGCTEANVGNDLKRQTILKESFKENYKKYLSAFTEKISPSAATVYKHSLFLEAKNLENDELQKLIFSFLGKDENNEICNKTREKVLNLFKTVLEEETNIIKKLKSEKQKQRIKKASKITIAYLLIALVVFSLKFTYDNFIDIEGVYKNNYLKNATLSLAAVQYADEFKDSLDPLKNEIRQRQRLDLIRDLNLRYFKIITLFLSPDLNYKLIKDSFLTLPISEELKDIQTIKTVRTALSNLFTQNEWKKDIEPMVGLNVLEELRAYGAICNFLVPSLAHHVIKDENGLPLKKDSKIQMFNPSPEKEILRKILLERFKKLTDEKYTEPKDYIDKYDENYMNIKNTCNLLFKKVRVKKTELFSAYKKSTNGKKSQDIKYILRAVAMLESTLEDLQAKVQKRHDFIVKHNTYRALT